jgi:hypothetical protein
MSKKPKYSTGFVDRNLTVSTAQEFMQMLSPLHNAWKDTYRDWIFRGVGDGVHWQLIPPVLRQPAPILKYTSKLPVSPSTHSKQIELEYVLLWEFFRVADGQGLLIPEDSQIYRSPWANRPIMKKLESAKNGKGPWPFDELMSLAALAQHHGVPTRLLDWSNNAFTAAYFAASEAVVRLDRVNHGKCAICGARPGSGATCSHCGSVMADQTPDKLFLAVWCLNWRYVLKRWPGDDADNIKVLLVMAPRATNPNLHAQGGVFTVNLEKHLSAKSPINRDSLDKIIENSAIIIKDVDLPVMRRIMLPIQEAGKLLRYLADQNIHAASIYPGFDGIVKHLNEWRLWDRPPQEQDLPIH